MRLTCQACMQATGKNFVMDDKFNLGDLLKLELHNYVDACSEIVDRAQKELVIEKSLRKIEDTWGALNLTFSPYQASPLMRLVHPYPMMSSGSAGSSRTIYSQLWSLL